MCSDMEFFVCAICAKFHTERREETRRVLTALRTILHASKIFRNSCVIYVIFYTNPSNSGMNYGGRSGRSSKEFSMKSLRFDQLICQICDASSQSLAEHLCRIHIVVTT